LLRRLGFEEDIRGSHHNFRKAGIEQKINLQKDGSHAKAYPSATSARRHRGQQTG